MEIHIHLHSHPDEETAERLRWIDQKLGIIIHSTETMMATLDQILSDVTDESTQIDGIATLVTGLRQQLADALAGTTLPPATQAKVDAIFAQAEVNKQKIADALNANTPPTT